MADLPNKITPEFLESEITNVEYRRLTGTMTHCTITVKNGFTFTGESACVDTDNYNQELGEKFALENAKSKMWVPYGFMLKQQLADDAAWKADPHYANSSCSECKRSYLSQVEKKYETI